MEILICIVHDTEKVRSLVNLNHLNILNESYVNDLTRGHLTHPGILLNVRYQGTRLHDPAIFLFAIKRNKCKL